MKTILIAAVLAATVSTNVYAYKISNGDFMAIVSTVENTSIRCSSSMKFSGADGYNSANCDAARRAVKNFLDISDDLQVTDIDGGISQADLRDMTRATKAMNEVTAYANLYN